MQAGWRMSAPKLCPKRNVECNAWSEKVCGFEVVEGRGRCRHDGELVVGFGKDYVSEFAGEGEEE